ncbi:hypothetical protein F383_09258 [Gossypium arboreum]|uniref:Uncharacterized protein n=1 Tax=Gossypium arboreum TaxID=29729 RepID=A0A0B0PI79_GOSAR|nr:hypothetical protein F383_09258 [Gossypium arboreum]
METRGKEEDSKEICIF